MSGREPKLWLMRQWLLTAVIVASWLYSPTPQIACAMLVPMFVAMCCCRETCSFCSTGFQSNTYQIDIPTGWGAGAGCSAANCDANFSGTFIVSHYTPSGGGGNDCFEEDATFTWCVRAYRFGTGVVCGGDGAIVFANGKRSSNYITQLRIHYCYLCDNAGGIGYHNVWEFDHGTSAPDCEAFSALSLTYNHQEGTCFLPPVAMCDGSGITPTVTSL